MRTLLSLAVAALLAVPVVASAEQCKWTGYVTDTHCGKNGATKDHTAACVEKCMKGGSHAQLMNDADGKIYDLDSFDKVKPLMGSKVTVTGTLEGNTIKVASAEKAGDAKK